MKTQYAITLTEAQRIVEKYWSYHEIEGTVVIVTDPPSTKPRLPESGPDIMEAVNYIRGHFAFRAGGKIAAINWYLDWAREHGLNCSLAGAKYFVESLT